MQFGSLSRVQCANGGTWSCRPHRWLFATSSGTVSYRVGVLRLDCVRRVAFGVGCVLQIHVAYTCSIYAWHVRVACTRCMYALHTFDHVLSLPDISLLFWLPASSLPAPPFSPLFFPSIVSVPSSPPKTISVAALCCALLPGLLVMSCVSLFIASGYLSQNVTVGCGGSVPRTKTQR